MDLKSLEDADVAGKRVLLRMSLNVPLGKDGKVSDLFRLKRSLPTLEYLAQRGAKIIVVGYFGRAGESLKPVVDALQELVPHVPMRFFAGAPEDAGKEAATLAAGEALVLENIRKHPGEEKNDPALARSLAALADVYVDDAFAEAHRAYASNVGVATLLPSCAGFLMEEEVKHLTPALNPPPGAVAIVGGAKFETKQPLIEKLLGLYSKVLLGGALGNDMLKSRGFPFGSSLISNISVPEAIAGNERLLAPTDAAFMGGSMDGRTSAVTDTRADEKIVDIGPETALAWAKEIEAAPFVLWNGPMGVYEQGYTQGTDLLAGALAASDARAIIGGGDTAAAVSKFNFDPDRVFISSGGGAMLEFLISGTLPALEVLKK
jgi:phosphoglycerate kinase